MDLSATESFRRKFTAQTAIRDACCILFLVLSAYFLYYVHAPYLSVSADGFRLAYYDHLGTMPFGSFHFYNGRPLLTIAWYVARLCTGGSVTGYNTFMFSCITLSSVLVYVIVRAVLSGGARWALAAATLKLTWAASIEVFDNSSLAVFFVESALLIAIWILILSANGRRNFGPLLQGSLILVLGAALAVTICTYQTTWFIVLLCPVVLACAGTILWRAGRARLFLLAWYGVSLCCIAWCAWLLVRSPDGLDVVRHDTSPVWGTAARTWIGLKVLTVESSVVLFQRVKEHLPREVLWTLLSGTGVFVVLFCWTSLRAVVPKDGSDEYPVVRPPFARTGLTLALFGFLLIVAALLPPCVRDTPYYGSRTVYFASFGFILIVLTLTGSIARKWPRGGAILACVLLGIFASASALQLRWGGNHITTASIWYRRFCEQLVLTVPGVSEDTVVVVEGFADTPENPFADSTWTRILRDLTDTRRTFLLVQGTPSWDASTATGPQVVMDTGLDLARAFDNSLADPRTTGRPFTELPATTARNKVTFLPQRVVWLRWNHEFGTLAVVKERSAMERLLPGLGSAYARRLFPKHGMVGGGADSVMVNQLAVPHFASSAPVQVRYGTSFYNGRLSAVAAFSHNALLVLLAPDGQCQLVGLQDSTLTVQIPENGPANGTQLRFKLNAVTGKGELHISLEGGEVQHLSLDATPVNWVSPELSSGVHRFHFRWEGDTKKGVPHVYVSNPQFDRSDSAGRVLTK